MSYKVLWNSLLATPALLGAALIVSSSAIAAEKPSTDAEALLGDITSVSTLEAAAPVSTEAAPIQLSAMPAAEVAPAAEATFAPVADLAPVAEVAPAAEAPAQVAQTMPVPAAPVAPAAQPAAPAVTTPAATTPAPSVDSLNQVIQYS
ncbi:MAG: hypothetical protein MUF49_12340, partial [Oculatellaceae cyanobacterium Prado106]|nr:hypothetical protein [Oculatellaceae cyanobacterium Prado106]